MASTDTNPTAPRGSRRRPRWLRRRTWATAWRRLTGRPDTGRWSGTGNLPQRWDERTERLAAMLPAGASVLEFGAGRMVLRRLLPPGTAYTPSDVVDRGPGTIVCDLNGAALPDFPAHDVAFFAGVLEYVRDVPRLVAHLAPRCRHVVLSYAVTDEEGWITRTDRRAHGWVSDLGETALLEIFAAHGFRPVQRDTWRRQRLFRFDRDDASPSGGG